MAICVKFSFVEYQDKLTPSYWMLCSCYLGDQQQPNTAKLIIRQDKSIFHLDVVHGVLRREDNVIGGPPLFNAAIQSQ